MDVATCLEAGSDPVAWNSSDPGRILLSFISRTVTGTGERLQGAVVGKGLREWKNIFEAAESGGGVEYYLIEQEAADSRNLKLRAGVCRSFFRLLRPA